MTANQSTENNILSMQPQPLEADVFYVATGVGSGWATTISRDWASADDARRCRLCPLAECTARGRDHCTVVAHVYVPEESAPLFSLSAGCRWVDPMPRSNADRA